MTEFHNLETMHEVVAQPAEAVTEAPVEQTVVEAQPEVAPEPVPEVVPPSPIETITEGEPEIPEYLRRLAGVKTENI
jgi:hypothetical protein